MYQKLARFSIKNYKNKSKETLIGIWGLKFVNGGPVDNLWITIIPPSQSHILSAS